MKLQKIEEKNKQIQDFQELNIKSERNNMKNQILPQINNNQQIAQKNNNQIDKQDISTQLRSIRNLYISPTHTQLKMAYLNKYNSQDTVYQNALPSKLPIKKQSFYGQKLVDDNVHNYGIKTLRKIQLVSVNSEQPLQKAQFNDIPKFDPARHSNKKNGIICSYAANTHQGNTRNYNEDRVSIILNMMKPECKNNESYWPECSFFAIYDGHGGHKCADFLRDQLHQMIIRDEDFPKYPKKSISRCIYKIEKLFIENSTKNQNKTITEKSGSCIVLALIVDKKCYIANVGDSRAMIYSIKNKKIKNLTIDHKPNYSVEKKRITENGGQIYQSYAKQTQSAGQQATIIYGPFRVFPGRLSVSRTIGDCEAKLQKFGGNPNCVVCKPDIKEIDIQNSDDFLILGCDGIFEKMDNKDVCKVVLDQEMIGNDFHKYTANCVDDLIKEVLISKSMDNLTIVMLSFQNFLNYFNENNGKGTSLRQYKKIEEEEEYEHDPDISLINNLEKDIQQTVFSKYNKQDYSIQYSDQQFKQIYPNHIQQNQKLNS